MSATTPSRTLLAATLAAAALLASGSAEALDVPLVYVRVKRDTTPVTLGAPVTIGGVTSMKSREIKYTDIYMALPEVARFFGGFSAPADLVYRLPDGTERLLYDCSSKSTDMDACAAMDPAVSFDGTTIAFTLFHGTLEHFVDNFRATTVDPAAENEFQSSMSLPGTFLNATDAQLMLVDVASGKITELPHAAGVFDSGAAWLSNGRVAFTSSRSNDYTTLVWGTYMGGLVPQIFTMDADGRNVELASPHALGAEQHPLQLLDGRVAYASWQLFGRLPFRTRNDGAGSPGTIANFFHMFAQHPDGAEQFAIFGQHTVNADKPTHDAAHFFAQTTDGRVWTADYYRFNNNGLGVIYGFPLPEKGQEGIGPDEQPAISDIYRPRNFVIATPFGGQFDDNAGHLATPFVTPDYTNIVRAGKAGHPAALPDNEMMITYGLGSCFNYGNEFTTPLDLEADAADQPGCDVGIYRMKKIPAESPDDLELIVNSTAYHEFMGRAVVPYSAIYGVDAPADIPRADKAAAGNPDLPLGTPYGILGAASMRYRETKPIIGMRFDHPYVWGLQGTDTADYTDDEICGVRILGVQPNQLDEYKRLFAPPGERVVILGEVPVKNVDPSGNPVLDAMAQPDTSFRVSIPASTPYLMQAIDCQGRTLNSDQTWQHLQPGEQKTCGGCHVHGKPGMDFDKSFAARPDYVVARLGEGKVPLLDGEQDGKLGTHTVDGQAAAFEFARDVYPILEDRCASCHGGSAPAAGLALDLAGTDDGSTWWRLVVDQNQGYVPEALRFHGESDNRLNSPNLSKYVRFMNARGSLLYWKAANARTDGRTDAQYGTDPGDQAAGWNDVDFGADHPTGITPQELATIARWIDTGASAGDGFLVDTTRPALTLVGDVDGDAVKGLFVGTTDVPSGIDPRTLEVCIVDATDGCGEKLDTAAAPNGIATVKLASPLADPDVQVRARVRDLAGNETVLERTVRRLLDQPPPPATGAGGASSGAGASGSGLEPGAKGGDGACGCALPGAGTTSWAAALALGLGMFLAFARARAGFVRSGP